MSDVENILLKITNSIRDAIRPDISIFTECEIEEKGGKSIIVIKVMPGTRKPYYLKEKGLREGSVYVRQGSSSCPASETAIIRMIKETDGDKFENVRSFLQDLTFEYMTNEFNKRNIELSSTQMKTLGIINLDNMFTNLGLLFSDQCVHEIKFAAFQGLDKTQFKDRREFSGSILKQMTDAYEHINKYNRIKSTFEGLERIDARDYPATAIREALLNSITHRDYSLSGSTFINIYDDRMEFISLGGLVAGISSDDITAGISQTRNEKLANILYRLRLIESYGTGILKILGCYKGYSIQPEFKITSGVFTVILPNINECISCFGYGLGGYGLGSYGGVNIRISEANVKILDYLKGSGHIRRKDVEVLLGIKQTAAGKLLKNLEQQGIIERVNNGKNSVYIRKPPR